MSDFSRWTERARQVVVLAQEEARNLKHAQIGTEHLLLGLLREEEGLAARTLEALDITVERVRNQVVRIVGRGDVPPDGSQLVFTPRVKKVLDLSLREALSLGHNYIGTEHVLLGLVRETDGIAARILLEFDADSELIRNEVLRMLSGPRSRTRKPPDPVKVALEKALAQNEDLRAEIIALKLHARSLAEELSGAWWIRAAEALRALTDLADDGRDVYEIAAERIAGEGNDV